MTGSTGIETASSACDVLSGCLNDSACARKAPCALTAAMSEQREEHYGKVEYKGCWTGTDWLLGYHFLVICVDFS